MSHQHMKRIIVHWTAGAGGASALDRKHYHRLVEWDGSVVEGAEAIEDNIVTGDGDYAAHTLRLNTGSIGVALCGMMGAVEEPFDAGTAPIREGQFNAACGLIAELCLEYGIAVTPETVLSHAEVQPTLGVKQRGKWDISVLPWRLDLRGARRVGDHMRERVSAAMGILPPVNAGRPLLRFGDHSVAVMELQTDLADLGYFSGRLDGHFGNLTRASVLAFQAETGLATDGVAGPATWNALLRADPRPPREITQEEIDAESGTAGDAKMTGRVGDLIGVGGIGAAVEIGMEFSSVAERASGGLATLTQVATENWQALVVLAGCAIAFFALRALSANTRKRRLTDAREHRSLAR